MGSGSFPGKAGGKGPPRPIVLKKGLPDGVAEDPSMMRIGGIVRLGLAPGWMNDSDGNDVFEALDGSHQQCSVSPRTGIRHVSDSPEHELGK
jgi:hypothetical protein